MKVVTSAKVRRIVDSKAFHRTVTWSGDLKVDDDDMTVGIFGVTREIVSGPKGGGGVRPVIAVDVEESDLLELFLDDDICIFNSFVNVQGKIAVFDVSLPDGTKGKYSLYEYTPCARGQRALALLSRSSLSDSVSRETSGVPDGH